MVIDVSAVSASMSSILDSILEQPRVHFQSRIAHTSIKDAYKEEVKQFRQDSPNSSINKVTWEEISLRRAIGSNECPRANPASFSNFRADIMANLEFGLMRSRVISCWMSRRSSEDTRCASCLLVRAEYCTLTSCLVSVLKTCCVLAFVAGRTSP